MLRSSAAGLVGVAILSSATAAHAQLKPDDLGGPPRHGGSVADRGPPPAGVSPIDWYFPANAQRMEIEGKAVMECDVNAEGRLQACALISETPRGYGFGEAALEVSRHFRMKPTLGAEGQPVPGGRITIPLVWRPAK